MNTLKSDSLIVPPPTRTQLYYLSSLYRKLAITVFLNALADLHGESKPQYRLDAIEFLQADPLGSRDIDMIFAHWYHYVSDALPLSIIRNRTQFLLNHPHIKISRNVAIAQLKAANLGEE